MGTAKLYFSSVPPVVCYMTIFAFKQVKFKLHSDGTATRYRLDSPGVELRWGRDVTHPSRPAQGSFSGVKQPERGVDHPPQSNAEVKERVELYLYSAFGLS
jgi:hypothetical protein